MDDAMRRSLPLFPIGIVQRLTSLSARQIRYYEQHELIHPQRTEGNQRLFSFRDVEALLEIKNLIDQGLNIAGIKAVMNQETVTEGLVEANPEVSESERRESVDMTDAELHELLLQELAARAGLKGNAISTIQGELSRFFKPSR